MKSFTSCARFSSRCTKQDSSEPMKLFISGWLRIRLCPFGENNRHVPVRLIDFENLENNSFIITNQYTVRAAETKIPDIACLINGIPVVIGEAKTPIRPSISWVMELVRYMTFTRTQYHNSLCLMYFPSLQKVKNSFMDPYAVH